MRKLTYTLILLIIVFQNISVCESYKQHIITVPKVELKEPKFIVESDYNQNKQEEKIVVSRGMPRETNGRFKTFMDYRTITNKSSKQYALQQECWTDDDGIRRHDEYYVVAMGTYYSESVGKKFVIHFDNGNSIDVIIGDIKDNAHTDSSRRFISHNGNIVEFVVDSRKISDLCGKMGDMSYSSYTDLSGGIIKIEEIVE